MSAIAGMARSYR